MKYLFSESVVTIYSVDNLIGVTWALNWFKMCYVGLESGHAWNPSEHVDQNCVFPGHSPPRGDRNSHIVHLEGLTSIDGPDNCACGLSGQRWLQVSRDDFWLSWEITWLVSKCTQWARPWHHPHEQDSTCKKAHFIFPYVLAAFSVTGQPDRPAMMEAKQPILCYQPCGINASLPSWSCCQRACSDASSTSLVCIAFRDWQAAAKTGTNFGRGIYLNFYVCQDFAILNTISRSVI